MSLYRIGCVRFHKMVPLTSGVDAGCGTDVSVGSRGGSGGGYLKGEEFYPATIDDLLVECGEAPVGAAAIAAATTSASTAVSSSSASADAATSASSKTNVNSGANDVLVSSLSPAHIMTRHYLRYGTMALFPTIGE